MQHIIRLPIVKARTGLSRSSIYLKISKGTFPKQIHIGIRAVGWLESDINDFIQKCVDDSRNGIDS